MTPHRASFESERSRSHALTSGTARATSGTGPEAIARMHDTPRAPSASGARGVSRGEAAKREDGRNSGDVPRRHGAIPTDLPAPPVAGEGRARRQRRSTSSTRHPGCQSNPCTNGSRLTRALASCACVSGIRRWDRGCTCKRTRQRTPMSLRRPFRKAPPAWPRCRPPGPP
jgi:hypothetical protein